MRLGIQSHPGLAGVLRAVKWQIERSKSFAYDYLPAHKLDPQSLYYFLKNRTSFIDDPQGVELIQSMPSLFLQNAHGVPGAGDCDCLTVTMGASILVSGYQGQIVIAGNKKNYPSHIYPVCIDRGASYIMDLTESFNRERPYKYYQNFEL